MAQAADSHDGDGPSRFHFGSLDGTVDADAGAHQARRGWEVQGLWQLHGEASVPAQPSA